MDRYLTYDQKDNRLTGIYYLTEEEALRKTHTIKGRTFILPAHNLFLLNKLGIYQLVLEEGHPVLINHYTREKYFLTIISSRRNGRYNLPENVPYKNFLYSRDRQVTDGYPATLVIIGKGHDKLLDEGKIINLDDRMEISLAENSLIRYVSMDVFVKAVSRLQGIDA